MSTRALEHNTSAGGKRLCPMSRYLDWNFVLTHSVSKSVPIQEQQQQSTTKTESCCQSGHFFRAVQTLSLHLCSSVVADVVDHVRKDDLAWKTFGFVPVLRRVSRTSCLSMLIVLPAMSLVQISLFMTASAFSSQNFEALVGSTAPGLVEKTMSETTCTIAMRMLPVGPPSNR